MAILRDFVFLHYIAVKYQNRHGHGAGTGTGIGAVVGSGLGHWQMQSALENLKVSLVQAGSAVLLSLPDQPLPSPPPGSLTILDVFSFVLRFTIN